MQIAKKTFTVFLSVFIGLLPIQAYSAPNQGHTQVLYSTSAGGRGYTRATEVPAYASAATLGALAIVTIVALALYKQGNAHSHSH